MNNQDRFYVFLSNEDSKTIYPQNSPQDFIVQLPERIKLYGSWSVALTEVSYPFKFRKGIVPNWLDIEVDVCEASIVGDQKQCILRRLPISGKHLTFNPPFFFPVRHQEIDSIHVYIKDESGAVASFTSGLSYCTLQFVKHASHPGSA